MLAKCVHLHFNKIWIQWNIVFVWCLFPYFRELPWAKRNEPNVYAFGFRERRCALSYLDFIAMNFTQYAQHVQCLYLTEMTHIRAIDMYISSGSLCSLFVVNAFPRIFEFGTGEILHISSRGSMLVGLFYSFW